jgi:hypothetical protein
MDFIETNTFAASFKVKAGNLPKPHAAILIEILPAEAIMKHNIDYLKIRASSC